MATTISLGAEKNVTLVAAKTVTLSAVTVTRWVDRPAEKIVLAFVQEMYQPVTLWSSNSNPTYDQIADWTTSQAEARLTEVINAM